MKKLNVGGHHGRKILFHVQAGRMQVANAALDFSAPQQPKPLNCHRENRPNRNSCRTPLGSGRSRNNFQASL